MNHKIESLTDVELSDIAMMSSALNKNHFDITDFRTRQDEVDRLLFELADRLRVKTGYESCKDDSQESV